MTEKPSNETLPGTAPYQRERYIGVSEPTAIVTRGLAFGIPGYFLGKWMAPNFMTKRGVKSGNVPKNVGYAFAAVLGIMGAYQASRDARNGREQMHRVQDTASALYSENTALRALLTHSKPEEKSTELPEQKISASDAHTETLSDLARERVELMNR